MKRYRFKIHQTPIILFFRVLLLIFFSDIIILAIIFAFDFKHKTEGLTHLLSATEEIVIGLMIFQFVMISYHFLSWIQNYYWLENGILFHQEGIIWKNVKEYVLLELEAATYTQSLWGRIFDYGTVKLVFANQEFTLPFIPHPRNFIKMINEQKLLFKQHTAKNT